MLCRKCKQQIPDNSIFCNLCGAKQNIAKSPQSVKKRGNGQGTAYKLPNGKWRVEVTLGYDDEKRIVKTKSGFKTKKEALAYIPVLKNTPVGVDHTIKFKELYDKWSESYYQRIGKDTEYGYVAAFKHCETLHFLPFISLKTTDLQKVVDDCPYQRRTKADIKSLLNQMYKFAIQNDYCDKNYASFIKLPKKEKSKRDAFTSSERDLLWKAYENGDEIAGYILIMIYTGMRYGEISTVLVDNIHLEEQYLIGGIKTDAGIDRAIPLYHRIIPIIERFLETKTDKLLDIPEKKYYNLYYATLEKHGIRKLSPHCCRHTCASALAEAGVQPAIIKEILGHEDYSTTTGYTHISIDKKIKAINKIDLKSDDKK